MGLFIDEILLKDSKVIENVIIELPNTIRVVKKSFILYSECSPCSVVHFCDMNNLVLSKIKNSLDGMNQFIEYKSYTTEMISRHFFTFV